MKCISAITVAAATLLLPAAAQAQILTFYEKNNCRGREMFINAGTKPVTASCKEKKDGLLRQK